MKKSMNTWTVNINLFFRQILHPTYTISFAKGNTTILSFLSECSVHIANSEHYFE
jgi:hypothetical protein